MTVPPFLELAEQWRRTAADMRECGADPIARCLEKCAADVEEAVRSWRLEELTLQEAAVAVGMVEPGAFEAEATTEAARRRDEWNKRRPHIAPLVYKRDGRRCACCGATENLTIDHIVPIVLGGTDEMENLQVLCFTCNVAKGVLPPEEWGGLAREWNA